MNIDREVQELEIKLRNKKQEKMNADWNKITDTYTRIGNYLKGKDIIHFYHRTSWAVTRITDFHAQYDMSSGAYGQWDKRRYLCLVGQRFSMDSNNHERTFSTDGTVYFEEIVKGLADVKIDLMMLGIPLEPKEQWGRPWNRFLKLGELNARRIILSIGEKDYKEKNLEGANQTLSDFMVSCRLAPKGIYDELAEFYWKKVKLAHELYLKYPEDREVHCTSIDWDKI